MPRAKVAPQNRLRVVQACQSCRSSKRRCDGQLPCQICVRRNHANTCTYAPCDVGSSPTARSSARLSSVAQTPYTVLSGSLPKRRLRPAATPPQWPIQRPTPTGRVLLDERGEQVYVNSVSGLSLLQFLKSTLKDRMGSSRFATEPDNDAVLDASAYGSASMPREIDAERKNAYLQSYFVASSGILDIYSLDELELYHRQESLGQLHPDTLQTAALNLAVAIGAQSKCSEIIDQHVAAAGFGLARDIAFRERLEHASVDLVRVFLLMAFYMVGASRRHAATMHLGIAATTAIMLGLHDTQHYAQLSEETRSLRWRTYRCLLIMDHTNATLLGRPMLTPSLTDGKPAVEQDYPDCLMYEHSTSASFDICSIVHTQTQHAGQDLRLPPADALLAVEHLREWASTWKGEPRGLRATGTTVSHPLDSASVVGDLHASCLYYHALILVTRPSLVDALVDRATGHPRLEKSCSSSISLQLHTVCIDAAICAVQTCYDAHRTGYVMNSQCHIIRPILFEVGLILGFVMAVHAEGILHVEDAFRKTRKLLKFFARTSSLAANLYDMLTSLLEAVMMQRTENMRKSTYARTPLVERLVDFEHHEVHRRSVHDAVPSVHSQAAEDIVLEDNIVVGETSSDDVFFPDQWQAFSDQVSNCLPFEADALNFFLSNV